MNATGNISQSLCVAGERPQRMQLVISLRVCVSQAKASVNATGNISQSLCVAGEGLSECYW